jgi:hypothetical protein
MNHIQKCQFIRIIAETFSATEVGLLKNRDSILRNGSFAQQRDAEAVIVTEVTKK